MVRIHVKDRLSLTLSSPAEKRLLDQYWEDLCRDRFGDDVDGIYPPDLEASLYHRTQSQLLLPSGLLEHLCTFLSSHGVAHQVIDERGRAAAVYQGAPILRPYQEAPCRSLRQFAGGVLVAPPGSGKTVMAMHLIATLRQKALWITQSPQLAWQAAEKARHFLGIAAFGQVNEASGLYRSEPLTIAVPGKSDLDAARDVGMLVVDEAHKLDASPALALLAAQHSAGIKIGLTAYEPPPIVRHLIGPVTARLTLQEMQRSHGVLLPRHVAVPSTHAGKAFHIEGAIRDLIKDQDRNELIGKLVLDLARDSHQVMVLSGNAAHCADLAARLGKHVGDQVGVITAGSHGQVASLKRAEAGAHSILVGDESLFEGMDLPHFDRLVLALPTADPRSILQQAGRIMRPADCKRDAVIYDIVDSSPLCLAQLTERRIRCLRQANDWTMPLND